MTHNEYMTNTAATAITFPGKNVNVVRVEQMTVAGASYDAVTLIAPKGTPVAQYSAWAEQRGQTPAIAPEYVTGFGDSSVYRIYLERS